MKRKQLYFLFLLATCTMQAVSWTPHLAFNDVAQITLTSDRAFVLSGGQIYSIDIQTGERHVHTMQEGFSSGAISYMHYNQARQQLLLFRSNGYVDVITQQGIHTISDLYISSTTASRIAQTALQMGDTLLLGMPYGVQMMHLRDLTFVDSYIIGPEASDIAVHHMTRCGNQLYAASDSVLFCADLHSNLVDYRNWSNVPFPAGESQLQGLATLNGCVLGLFNHHLYVLRDSTWESYSDLLINSLTEANGHLLGIASNGGVYDFNTSSLLMPHRQLAAAAYDAAHSTYWLANNSEGLFSMFGTTEQLFPSNSPAINLPYYMSYAGEKLYVVPGGKWSAQFLRPGYVMTYEHGEWNNLSYEQFDSQGYNRVEDIISVAVDPSDPHHYYMGTYGRGLYEMRDSLIIRRLTASNAPLTDASGVDPDNYTRVANLMYDADGNLWMNNNSTKVLRPDSTWLDFSFKYQDGSIREWTNAQALMFDPTNPNRVWGVQVRSVPGFGFYDTGGTLDDLSDDQTLFRDAFINEDGQELEIGFLYACTFDNAGTIWLGAANGLFYKPAETDFTQSAELRHLGTMDGDVDWFLKEQAVKCIVIDTTGRKWIGTEALGLYALSPDNLSVEAHYTTTNSALMSNNILSLAINPVTGVIMVGTSAGIVELDYSEEEETGLTEDELENLDTDAFSGMMNGWTFHAAYGNVSELATYQDEIFGLSEGSLFAVNSDDEVRAINSLNGLTGAGIGHIMNDAKGQLVLAYKDGNIDIYDGNKWHKVTDLNRKQLTGVNKLLYNAYAEGNYIYMAMQFGVLVLNTQKHEFAEWFPILELGYPNIERIRIIGDTLYALSATKLYTGSLHDNLVDHNAWHSEPFGSRAVDMPSIFRDRVSRGSCTYYIHSQKGIMRQCGSDETYFLPNGPYMNTPYRMTVQGDKLWLVAGGRWATQYNRRGGIMIYEDGEWHNITAQDIEDQSRLKGVEDLTRVAVDPTRDNHIAVSSYGHGVLELEDDRMQTLWLWDNSPLESAVASDKNEYTRTDGVVFDQNGYLWLANAASSKCLKVMSPDHQWAALSVRASGSLLEIGTPGDVLVDNHRKNCIWMVSARGTTGLALLDHNGTPMNASDDRSIFRSTFVDGSGKQITPNAIYSIAQDRTGQIWVGTNEGIFMIPTTTDFFTSNHVTRHIIRREDGSGLGDYMLGTEMIQGIAIDGANHLWCATASSGVYLMDPYFYTEDDVNSPRTIYHFTTTNSPLPSDNVLAVDVLRQSGEVFFATQEGLVSFRSDASDPEADYSSAYAYPNPVRPDYEGVLTVTGLVDNSEVKIANAAGQVVYYGRSNGGTAVWNLKLPNGNRVTPGVYVIFCNAVNNDESQHAQLKVLIM